MKINHNNTVVLPLLPIKNSVLFPSIQMPLVVSRAASISALDTALATEDKQIAVFTQKDPSQEGPRINDLYKIGTLAVIKKISRTKGVVQVEVQGESRLEWQESVSDQPHINCKCRRLPDLQDHNTETEALLRVVLEQTDKMLALVRPELKGSLRLVVSGLEEEVNQAYLMAAYLPITVGKEVELLAAHTFQDLLELLHKHLNHEIQVLELRKQINSRVQSTLDSEQREHLLRRQLHAIQEQLGEERPEQADVDELHRKLKETALPESAQHIVEKELQRLQRMSAASPEYQLTRTYVEFVMDLPWMTDTKDDLNLDAAQQLLDAEHFNLKDIKQRIIEHLAIMQLNAKAKSPILCLVGPPGVGKTSIGQSIARAMGRRFERMSLGGLHDEAELRGHRRTYIGAMPGRILTAIRRAGSNNPLLMLDEVDKLGRDFRGDPAAALLEILDPAQNAEFRDNYLDMPFDLSKVFFITTANTLENIPEPLLDRMEVLRISGYSTEEKVVIARRFLLPKQIADAGLSEAQLLITDDGLLAIIRRYTREAGVRNLERSLGALARKIASQIAKGESSEMRVTPESLLEILGPAPYHEEQIRQPLPAGVVAGLAWTPAGGQVLYVEAALLARGSPLLLTGQLGEVMQESAKIAQSYVWSNADRLGIKQSSIRHSSIHIHVPAGAVPKDGPSAGVTMVSALVSLYTGMPVRTDIAMTGEITLSGLVLPVGGVKEKVLAAHRAGINTVILPADNQKDLHDLTAEILEVMHFEYVEQIDQLLPIAMPNLMLHSELPAYRLG